MRLSLLLLAPACAPATALDALDLEAVGKAAQPAWHVDGVRPGQVLGSAVVLADIDGDGDDDVIVTSPGYADGQAPAAGAVDVFRAEAGIVEAAPAVHFLGRAPGVRLGTAASAEDVDGDGAQELLVAAPGGTGVAGYVVILDLRPDGFAVAGEIPLGQEGEGVTVAGVGDVNGDGFGDVAIGQPAFQVGEGAVGRACLYVGGPEGLKLEPFTCLGGSPREPGFGSVLAAAGDVDGDGYEDMYVGAPALGHAQIFPGTPNGLSPTPVFDVRGKPGFGAAFASLGDLDQDGADDFVLGDPQASLGELHGVGALHLFRGGAHVPSAVFVGGAAGARLGATLVAADQDGDGRREVVAARIPAELPVADPGSVLVLAASPALDHLAPVAALDGEAPFGRYGQALAAGELLGGPGDELLIGAPGTSSGPFAHGRAELLGF